MTATIDNATAHHGRYIARLAQLAYLAPDEGPDPVVRDPRAGDLAVVVHRDIRRFGVLRRTRRDTAWVELLTTAAIDRAGRRALLVETGGDGDPRSAGYARASAQNARFRAEEANVVDIEAVVRVARHDADLDAAAARATQSIGRAWWACWAAITTVRVPLDDLVIRRD